MSRPRTEVCAALFAHEMMRRLGITSDDIFIDMRIADFFGIAVRGGGKEWSWTLGHLPIPAADFVAEWQAGVAWWNGASDEEIDALGFDSSPQMAMAAMVVASLVEKGIPLDPLADVRALDARMKAAN